MWTDSCNRFYSPSSLAKYFKTLLHFITMLKYSKGHKLNFCRVNSTEEVMIDAGGLWPKMCDVVSGLCSLLWNWKKEVWCTLHGFTCCYTKHNVNRRNRGVGIWVHICMFCITILENSMRMHDGSSVRNLCDEEQIDRAPGRTQSLPPHPLVGVNYFLDCVSLSI